MEIQGNIKWLKIKAKFQDVLEPVESICQIPPHSVSGATLKSHTLQIHGVFFFPEPSQSGVSAWMTSLR